jgi:hypothetical protein
MNFSGSDIVRIKDVTVATFDVDEIDPGKYKKRALDFVLYTKRRNITCDFICAAFAERLKVPEWQELSKICNAGPTIAAQQAGAPNPDAAAEAPMAAGAAACRPPAPAGQRAAHHRHCRTSRRPAPPSRRFSVRWPRSGRASPIRRSRRRLWIPVSAARPRNDGRR